MWAYLEVTVFQQKLQESTELSDYAAVHGGWINMVLYYSRVISSSAWTDFVPFSFGR